MGDVDRQLDRLTEERSPKTEVLAPRRRGRAEPTDVQTVLERHALALTTPTHGLPWQTNVPSEGHEAAVWMAARGHTRWNRKRWWSGHASRGHTCPQEQTRRQEGAL